MRGQTAPELLAAAHSRVSTARDLLSRPRTCNLEECAQHLQEAQKFLESMRDDLGKSGSIGREFRRPLIALSHEIRQAGALLEQAARFGRRWLERLRASTSTYTAAGGPGPLPANRRISLLG
jgi:hypothetical protein